MCPLSLSIYKMNRKGPSARLLVSYLSRQHWITSTRLFDSRENGTAGQQSRWRSRKQHTNSLRPICFFFFQNVVDTQKEEKLKSGFKTATCLHPKINISFKQKKKKMASSNRPLCKEEDTPSFSCSNNGALVENGGRRIQKKKKMS